MASIDTATEASSLTSLFFLWPGNIRELRNVIERTMLFEDGETIQKVHLPKELLDDSDRASGDLDPAALFREVPYESGDGLKEMSLDAIQKYCIERALDTAGGN